MLPSLRAALGGASGGAAAAAASAAGRSRTRPAALVERYYTQMFAVDVNADPGGDKVGHKHDKEDMRVFALALQGV